MYYHDDRGARESGPDAKERPSTNTAAEKYTLPHACNVIITIMQQRLCLALVRVQTDTWLCRERAPPPYCATCGQAPSAIGCLRRKHTDSFATHRDQLTSSPSEFHKQAVCGQRRARHHRGCAQSVQKMASFRGLGSLGRAENERFSIHNPCLSAARARHFFRAKRRDPGWRTTGPLMCPSTPNIPVARSGSA